MTDAVKTVPRKLTGLQRITAEIEDYRERTKLESWNSFVEELQVPMELYPALVSNRPEMIAMATPRALTADECKVLYRLIGGLIETNAALRQHTERVAQLTENLAGQMIGFQRVAQQIELFANFRNPEMEDGDEG